MKSFKVHFIVIVTLAIMISCGGGASGASDPVVNQGDVCPNPDAHVFWNEYKNTLDSFGVTDQTDLSNRLTFFDDVKAIIGSMSLVDLKNKVDHVCPNTSDAVTFYNNFKTIIGTLTTTDVQTAITFWNTFKSVIGSRTQSQVSDSLYTYDPTPMVIDGDYLTGLTPITDNTNIAYFHNAGIGSQNSTDITVQVMNLATKTFVNNPNLCQPGTNGFQYFYRYEQPSGTTYRIIITGTIRNYVTKIYRPIKPFYVDVTKP